MIKKISIFGLIVFFISSCATVNNRISLKNQKKPVVKESSVKIEKIVIKKEKALKKAVLEDNKSKPVSINVKEEIEREFKFENRKELEKEIGEIHEELFINNYLKLVINDDVKKFIRLYSKNNGRWLYDAFKRAHVWLPYMRQIFKEYGLPEELVYLCFIESHFNLYSRSRRGAVGPWQFMRRTAKKFGLKINWWIDERKDPIKSTVAAAKYLKYLYNLFGSYELALAGYNAGEYKILKAIKRYHTKNYWKLCKKRFLKKETKTYVPSFYAILFLIRNNPRLKFVPQEWIDYNKKDLIFIQIAKPYSLYRISKKIGIPYKKLLELNPELIRGITPPEYENYLLKAPKLYEKQLIALSKYIEKDYRFSFKTYKIRKGDSLYKIARRFGISYKLIKNFNHIRNVRALRIGQRILLPIPKHYIKVASIRQRKKPKFRVIKYKVKKGDSLWKVSNKFKVKVRDIISWNNLTKKVIYPGDVLKIIVR